VLAAFLEDAVDDVEAGNLKMRDMKLRDILKMRDHFQAGRMWDHIAEAFDVDNRDC